MSINRFAARNDENHRLITKALKDAGVTFWNIKFPCDLLAVHKASRRLVAIEIKRDAKAKETLAQQELRLAVGDDCYFRVETIGQALYAVGVFT